MDDPCRGKKAAATVEFSKILKNIQDTGTSDALNKELMRVGKELQDCEGPEFKEVRKTYDKLVIERFELNRLIYNLKSDLSSKQKIEDIQTELARINKEITQCRCQLMQFGRKNFSLTPRKLS
jgi:hypothetical protein